MLLHSIPRFVSRTMDLLIAKAVQFLLLLTGADIRIIARCDKFIKGRFLGIGIFLWLIFILSFWCCFYSLLEIFDSALISVPVAVFFSSIILNIYLLLIYTLNKNTLPTPKITGSIVVSRLIRVCFILFIAVLISKPIETIVYAEYLKKDIKNYQDTLVNHSIIWAEKIQQKQLSSLANSGLSPEQYSLESLSITENTMSKLNLNIQMIRSSNYFLRRLILLYEKHPTSWLITALISIIFLFPVFLLRFVTGSGYYEMKKESEMRIVDLNYFSFKKIYEQIHKHHQKKPKRYLERFSDPPYNTKGIPQPQIQDQDKLMAELYND